MEGKAPRNLRVKWVPSHKEEEHVRAGIISEEHRAGNAEADKLATRGATLHQVSKEAEAQVKQQDELVHGLLTMMLNIMKSVHDKAPVRKKEEKEENNNPRDKFFGPKTGQHGEHTLEDREEGGWKCTKCKRFATSHLGWRRLVRTKCVVRKKTDRTKWKAVFHRRRWLHRAARKEAAGLLTASHTPVRLEKQGRASWFCTTCGKCATRAVDLGRDCSGAPMKGNSRYWRMQQTALARYAQGQQVLTSRNACRVIQEEGPVNNARNVRRLLLGDPPGVPEVDAVSFPPLPEPMAAIGTRPGEGPAFPCARIEDAPDDGPGANGSGRTAGRAGPPARTQPPKVGRKAKAGPVGDPSQATKKPKQTHFLAESLARLFGTKDKTNAGISPPGSQESSAKKRSGVEAPQGVQKNARRAGPGVEAPASTLPKAQAKDANSQSQSRDDRSEDRRIGSR
eukprot:2722507-Heterocapsa_arctica.AAC.1